MMELVAHTVRPILLSANTWERKSITFDGDTVTAINNDNGRGLEFGWVLAAGSDYTGTSNAQRQAYSLGT